MTATSDTRDLSDGMIAVRRQVWAFSKMAMEMVLTVVGVDARLVKLAEAETTFIEIHPSPISRLHK